MNSVITDRFIRCHQKLKEDRKIRSSRQFAISLDYLPQSLSEILKGRRDVTIELIRKAVEKFQFNPNFLFTGEGGMFLGEAELPKPKAGAEIQPATIAHVPLWAMESYVKSPEELMVMRHLPCLVLPDKLPPGIWRSFEVPDQSMETLLFEGDKVVACQISSHLWAQQIIDNQVYVVVGPEQIKIKTIKNRIEESGEIEMRDCMQRSKPTRMAVHNIKELWMVKTRIGGIHMPKNAVERLALSDEINQIKIILENLKTS